MSGAPRVSVGLPVHNGERYLRESLDAFLRQTFGDFEVVISDNASTDGTGRICAEYLGRDPRIRYYRNEENIGGSPNHNRVMLLSRGEYFLWGSYDDVRHPEYLARCVAELDRDPALVICHSLTAYIDEEGRELPLREKRLDVESPSPSGRFRDLIRMDHKVEPILGVIRADVLRRTPLEGQYADCDRVLLAELGLHGPFRLVPERLFFRRQHPRQSARLYPSRQARTAWFDPKGAGRLVFPHFRQFREYLACIRRAPLPAAERRRCRVLMAGWLWVNRGRLWGDLLSGLIKIVLDPFRRK